MAPTSMRNVEIAVLVCQNPTRPPGAAYQIGRACEWLKRNWVNPLDP